MRTHCKLVSASCLGLVGSMWLRCAASNAAPPFDGPYCRLDPSGDMPTATPDGTAGAVGAAGAAGESGKEPGPSEWFDVESCREGHPCEPLTEAEDTRKALEGFGRCSTTCQDKACAPGSECRDGFCYRPDHCGRTIRCDDPSDLCDALADRCYPRNGACGAAVGCPQLRGEAEALAQTRCNETTNTCELVVVKPALSWLSPAQSLDAMLNAPRQGNGEDSELEFTWTATRNGVLLRILDRLPFSLNDWVDGARWRASRGRDAPNEIRFSEGEIRNDGEWKAAAGHSLPPGRYVFLALSINAAGAVTDMSEPLDFSVGEAEAALPASGDHCRTTEECYHPDRPQLCSDSVCRRLCASHTDCEGLGSCGDFAWGMRVCAG